MSDRHYIMRDQFNFPLLRFFMRNRLWKEINKVNAVRMHVYQSLSLCTPIMPRPALLIRPVKFLLDLVFLFKYAEHPCGKCNRGFYVEISMLKHLILPILTTPSPHPHHEQFR